MLMCFQYALIARECSIDAVVVFSASGLNIGDESV